MKSILMAAASAGIGRATADHQQRFGFGPCLARTCSELHGGKTRDYGG
jgi:hypothetical protein